MRQERGYCSLGWSDVDTNSAFQLSAGPSRSTSGVKYDKYFHFLIFIKIFLIFLQTEYFCDTNTAPAQATTFGDYIVIPGRAEGLVRTH